jgi:hypothetical protein
MKKMSGIFLTIVFLTFSSLTPASAEIKPGSTCSKVGTMVIYKKVLLTCKKNGPKKVWTTPGQVASNQLMELKSATQPTSFDNLFKNRKGISFAAWSNFNKLAFAPANSVDGVKIYVGPNTKPWYPSPIDAVKKVRNSFPEFDFPKHFVFIYYSFKDQSWAKSKLISLVSVNDFENFSRNENGAVTESNCDNSASNCQGAKALTAQDGTGFLLIGVPGELDPGDQTASYRMKTGMLEAHEYFHTLQDVPFTGANISGDYWPPRWVLEGGAEFVQNAAINNLNFEKYIDFRRLDGNDLYQKSYLYKEEFISDYLTRSNWSDSSFMDYYLGSRVIEILVALQGQQSLLDLNEVLASGMGFEKAFEKVYEYPWKSAIPIISKVIATRIQEEK